MRLLSNGGSRSMIKWSEALVAAAAVILLGGMLFFIWSDSTTDRIPPATQTLAGETAMIAPLVWPPAPGKLLGTVVAVKPEKPAVVTPPRHLPSGAPFSIALVIDDCGLSESATRKAMELPAAVTLSFLPYGVKAGALARAAKADGHDILLHMPMQPLGGADPGPDALTVGLSKDVITQRVQQGFAVLPDAVGLNNHMGSRFTEDAAGLAPVMQELKARGLFFLDSKTSPRSVGVASARAAGVPLAARDVFLDDTISEAEVRQQLAHAEKIARARGHAIAIGHPHPETLRVLHEWLHDLEQRGYQLVPLRQLVRPS